MRSVKKVLLRKVLSPEEYARRMGVRIGRGCEIYKHINWGSEPYLIEIGDNVRITNGVSFVTHDGGVWVLRHLSKREKDKNIDVFGKIVVGNNVHIGWNAIIMPGVTIGDNVVIGAGAIVTKNVDSNSVVVGVPARRIEDIDDYYKKVLQKCLYTKNMSPEDKKEKLIKMYNQTPSHKEE